MKTSVYVCPCRPTDSITKVYVGKGKQYVLCGYECKCPMKIPTKEFKQFPRQCSECATTLQEGVCKVEGLPERHYKWAFKTWIHQEFKSMIQITTAIAIPNSDQFIAITGNTAPIPI